MAEAERRRRKLGPDPELQLLHATIHYRAGDAAAAKRVLDPLLADPGLPPTTAARLNFLAGLLAADRADAPALRRHRDALPGGDARGEQADQLELDGRLAAIDGDSGEAQRLLDEAVLLRSLDDDYRGMVRVLVSAATLAERADNVALAGEYWLRAGRSGGRREEPDARKWLERARGLGERSGDGPLVLEAETTLRELGELP